MKSPAAGPREAWLRRLFFWGQLILLAAFALYRTYVGLVTPLQFINPAIAPPGQPQRTTETVRLTRGPFIVYRYEPGDPAFAAHPKATIIFGSGDGGLGGWEDRVCRALQADGCEMISVDCALYSRTDYDLATLQADMNTLAHAFPHTGGAPPLILGGWSMGADQAVAAGGGPNRPEGLAGLLLISPSARSRYGEREPDRWNISPTGPGTFALADFATSLTGLRVAQWNADLDLLGSTGWLANLTTTHKAYYFKLGLHDYDGACDPFLAELKHTVAWILGG